MDRVVGLDLSLTGTGFASLSTDEALWNHVDLERFSSAPAGDEWGDRYDRISDLADRIVLRVGFPRLIVLEAPAYGARTGHVHDRAGLWWLVFRKVRGRAATVVVSPTQRAKYATGRGNAGKDEVLAAVVRRYPWAEVENNDHADALILAALGARWLGCPVEESLPKSALGVVDKVRWPEIY